MKFNPHFEHMYSRAIDGKTSILILDKVGNDRGNKLKAKQYSYNATGIFDTVLDISRMPFSLTVSWDRPLAIMREEFKTQLASAVGPHDIAQLCMELREDKAEALLYAGNIAFDYCKIIMKIPFGNILKKIQEMDDNRSFLYLDNNMIVPLWTEHGHTGKYFYISEIKIAAMMRIAFGFGYESLTEVNNEI